MSRLESALLLSVVLVAVFVQVKSDMDIFHRVSNIKPADHGVGGVSVKARCSDSDCLQVTLSLEYEIQSPHVNKSFTLILSKRFDLLLARETCHHFVKADPFASIRLCYERRKPDDYRIHGTFFDDSWRRYDIVSRGDGSHVMSHALRSESDIHPQGNRAIDLESSLYADTANYSNVHFDRGVPYFRFYRQPLIELMIGIDESFMRFFNNDTVKVVKYACMVANSADAIWASMGVRVKLVGVRVWSEMGFSSNASNNDGFLDDKFRFLFHQAIDSRVVDFRGRGGENRIAGVPDNIVTMHHRYTDGPDGLAYPPYQGQRGACALVKPHYTSIATEDWDPPDNLFHYLAAAVLAHEVAHNFGFDHAPEGCTFRAGNCIMKDRNGWMIPFFRAEEVANLSATLPGLNRYLFQQNVRHADIVPRFLPAWSRGLWWSTCAVLAILDVALVIQYVMWLRRSSRRRGFYLWTDEAPVSRTRVQGTSFRHIHDD